MPILDPRKNVETDLDVLAAIERVLAGRHDPNAMRRAAERMDRMREEMRQRVGNVDLAVPLVREARDERGKSS